MPNFYLLLKLFHFISFISWMVGMLYLPRLYVYHCGAKIGTAEYNTFCIMEKRLLKIIMTPAMLATWFFGIALALTNSSILHETWLLLKMLLVVFMSGLHGFFAVCQRNFSSNTNKYSRKFYKVINEIPTVLLILILYLIIFRPTF